jgi:REP element-mobilizing transposase RayT
MRAPFTQLYVHTVWSTWDRLPLINPVFEPNLYAAVAVKCRELQCEPLAIGGIENHVHLLVRLNPTVAIATLVKEVKGASSHLVTHKISLGNSYGRVVTGFYHSQDRSGHVKFAKTRSASCRKQLTNGMESDVTRDLESPNHSGDSSRSNGYEACPPAG